MLGVLPEASVLAAALSLRSLFRHANPVCHDTATYTTIVNAAFAGRLALDKGMYSEPLATLALYCELLSLAEGKRGGVGADGAAPAAAGDDSGDGEADGGGGAVAAVAAEEEDGDSAVAADDDDVPPPPSDPGDDGGGGGGGGGEGSSARPAQAERQCARWCADHGIGFKLVGQLR